MAITTYAELKSSIANWLNRDDLTAVIPDFIALAEAQIARDIRHWRQEKRVTTSVNEQYENLVLTFHKKSRKGDKDIVINYQQAFE